MRCALSFLQETAVSSYTDVHSTLSTDVQKKLTGGSQGFIWLDDRLRVAYGKSDKDKSCVDATDLSEGDPLKITPCVKGGTPGKLQTYVKKTTHDVSCQMYSRW